MLTRINRMMRNILLIIGPILLVFKLMENKSGIDRWENEDFQTKEFDDIW